ncbi:MAG TPA: hypothetical protein VES20_04950 [Bryobacteraceae bacterium]|nr:hypothetical protein [Bryobacteraceae bacterium]
MRNNNKVLCLAGLTLLTNGCYNNPEISERRPGSGPHRIHSGPSVGPGRTAGGSTAGPQPARPELEGEVQPHPGGGLKAPPGASQAGAPRPDFDEGLRTPQGPASRMGNRPADLAARTAEKAEPHNDEHKSRR